MDEATNPGGWQVSDADVLAALVERERVARRVYAAQLGVWAEAQRRGITGGYRSLTGFARSELRISTKDAKQRSEDCAAVHGEPDLGGRSRPPRLPLTGQAVAAGEIGAGHVHAIQSVMRHCPTHLSDEERGQAATDHHQHPRNRSPTGGPPHEPIVKGGCATGSPTA